MFSKISDFFSLSEIRLSRYEILLLILIAYCFSLALRYYYPLTIDNPNFIFNNTPIISSSDGFWYADGAKALIEGDRTSLAPSNILPAKLTALIYYITPFSLDQIIFYMPAFFSSLIVIPLILIGRELKNPLLGFSVALLAVSTAGFYGRTMAGYYDDDYLTLILPFFILYFMIAIANSSKQRDREPSSIHHILGIATILFYVAWYQNAAIITTGMLLFMSFISLMFYRSSKVWLFIILAFIATLKLSFFIKLPVLMGMYAIWLYAKDRSKKIRYSILGGFGFISAVLFSFSGLFIQLITKFDSYISKKSTSGISADDGYGLEYYNSLQTVAESKFVDFSTFFEMIAWNETLFLLGTFGYFIAALRYKFLWFGFPLYFIGLSAADAGVRFASYGAPLVMLGVSYLGFLAADKIAKIYRLPLIYSLLGLMVLIYPLYKSYNYITTTIPGPTLLNYETSLLSYMDSVSDKKDYIISWWDYGYPVRYYANTLTHSDGGMQSGNLTYMESLALTSSSQTLASNLLRDGVEIKEKLQKDSELKSTGGTFGDIMKYNMSGETPSASKMIDKLSSKDYDAHSSTRNIYWMMMYRMLPIIPTISLFSSYDLQTKEPRETGLYLFSQTSTPTDYGLALTDNLMFDKNLGVVKLPNGAYGAVKKFITVDELNGDITTQEVDLNPDAKLYVILLKTTNSVIIVDETMFKSNFIQMFVFGNYDKELFEAVMINPVMKIYRLKN